MDAYKEKIVKILSGGILVAIKKVITLDDSDLRVAMKSLWADVLSSNAMPEVVVGIATGGVLCVSCMELDGHIKIFSCSMHRGSTKIKSKWGFKAILKRLPYFCTDQFRIIEDYIYQIQNKRRNIGIPEPTAVLRRDVSKIAEFVKEHKIQCVLVVDDAVDSGGTLGCVLSELRASVPDTVVFISAVVTQTFAKPLHVPDFRIYYEVLCRFPWSFDFKGPSCLK
jgi:hypoxanthine phosphoribosyltransferase